MITMMITKDDDKGDDKKLKDQSKNNSSETKVECHQTTVPGRNKGVTVIDYQGVKTLW